MGNQADRIEQINTMEGRHLDMTLRRNRQNPEEEQKIIKEIASIARGEINYSPNLNSTIEANNFHSAQYFLQALTFRSLNLFNWDENDELIKGYVTAGTLRQKHNYYQWQYIAQKLKAPAENNLDSFISFLNKLGLSNENIVKYVASFDRNVFSHYTKERTLKDTFFKKFITTNIEGKSSFFGLRKEKGLGAILNEVAEDHEKNCNRAAVLKILLEHDPKSIKSIDTYILPHGRHSDRLNLESLQILLSHDAQKYEKSVVSYIDKYKHDLSIQASGLFLLEEYLPGKYHHKIVELGDEVLAKFNQAQKGQYYNYGWSSKGSLEIAFCKYLLEKDSELAKSKILAYTYESKYISDGFLRFLDEEFGKEALPYLLNCLNKEYGIVDARWKRYFEKLFDLLSPLDLSPHTEDIIRFGINTSPKKYRILASNVLKKYIDIVTPRAQQLLDGKVNDRVFAAMILQHSSDQSIIDQLMTLIDTERSDDTRDIILDALHDIKFATPMNQVQANDMIAKADARKKLNKWGEKWIEEASLPKLYWKENGAALTETEIRYLFYRSKRIKGISSDIEAKQVIELLDDQKTEKFATALIKAYQDSNADSKFKYYLVMAGLIGKDSILSRLHTVFKSTVTAKRYRMAAMVVGAIAMVGSDKALRIVDMIARKFANKRPQIGKGAREALDAAAKEFDITMDQLADRIIPDFGFEDHYYTFMAGEDEYRAFINKEFKLNYFNEDNKLRKSMPKETTKEAKAELKAIEKEIKEVVKSQKGRLEGYLTTERKWEVEEWMEYYLSNPVMLIYVQRLLWGVYDESYNLKTVFYCDDDLELYDVEDEEVDIEEGTFISIVHPLHMSEELHSKWKEKVYDMDTEFEFEIINRVVTHIPEEEIERSVSKVLFDQEIPKGADFVAGFLLKKGWIKSTGDGGYLQFNKFNHAENINAYPNIEGPAVYYQGGETQARIFEINFYEKGTNQPKNLKDVPKVFYSEVVADLKGLINA
ncbi:MAG: DUF4132 domain-containing protein [Saprospiraceae bacterium]|nr:DUF4132 domain-containing protein [Saprospiraceae bacterium]